jgi:hypothetical protein
MQAMHRVAGKALLSRGDAEDESYRCGDPQSRSERRRSAVAQEGDGVVALLVLLFAMNQYRGGPTGGEPRWPTNAVPLRSSLVGGALSPKAIGRSTDGDAGGQPATVRKP